MAALLVIALLAVLISVVGAWGLALAVVGGVLIVCAVGDARDRRARERARAARLDA